MGLRLQVDKDLAVLLMRSSYAVADELDFIAMDEFQKSFFFVRQAEWEDYRDAYPALSVKQVWIGGRIYVHAHAGFHSHTNTQEHGTLT